MRLADAADIRAATNMRDDPMDNLDETASVISASKVTGTNVYNTDGDHLGEIYDIMLEKRSGNIAYAVMSFGGFLGIGERYHALPWANLKYDTRQGGYVVGLTIDQLKEAPTYAANELPAGVIVPLAAG
jgi:sporulation protein YlmC with PRC-barrel domain